MDLSTKYMGLGLESPLVASASPLSKEISNIKKLEDAGASAVVMSGADVTMFCAALLKNGIGRLSEIKKDMAEWMEKRGYESIEQIKGMMSHKSVENPAAFERANYMKALNEFKRGIS